MSDDLSKIACWCRNTNLTPFSSDYLRCTNCETLILNFIPAKPIDLVEGEDDFYGKNYWFEHMNEDLGFENIKSRARTDMPERVLYWLRTFLKYQLPPAKTLEIGCSHGAFVAALSWAGFNSTGLELSTWVVNYAKKTFGISVLQGKLEDQELETGSFDAIILMDVLEHMTAPLDTLKLAQKLLKPDGFFMIQTPCYPARKEYSDLIEESHPFLKMLQPPEHIFLFSENAIKKLFSELGFNNIIFEEPIFLQYDMFIFAAKQEFYFRDQSKIEKNLQGSPSGRLIQALLDLDVAKKDVEDRLLVAEIDRKERLLVIHEQGEKLGRIESERNILKIKNKGLKQSKLELEKDRNARLHVIQEQGDRLGQIEGENHNLILENSELKQSIRRLEEDRSARLKVIQEQGDQLGQIEGDRNKLDFEITDLKEQLRKSEEDRAARLEIINKQAIQYEELKTKFERCVDKIQHPDID